MFPTAIQSPNVLTCLCRRIQPLSALSTAVGAASACSATCADTHGYMPRLSVAIKKARVTNTATGSKRGRSDCLANRVTVHSAFSQLDIHSSNPPSHGDIHHCPIVAQLFIVTHLFSLSSPLLPRVYPSIRHLFAFDAIYRPHPLHPLFASSFDLTTYYAIYHTYG